MVNDPIVKEVRAVRDALAKRHGYDVDEIVRALQKASADAGGRVVTRRPKAPKGGGGRRKTR